MSSETKFNALVVAVLAVIGLGLMTIKPNFTRFAFGSIICISADSYRLKSKLGYRDVIGATREAFDMGGQAFSEEFMPVSDALGQGKHKLTTAAFRQLPLAAEIAKRNELYRTLKADALVKFADQRSGLILGVSGDGKTHLAHWILADFIRRHPDAHKVYVCDLDYGSGHGDNHDSVWFGLPLESTVLIDHDEIYSAILETAQLVEQRSQATKTALKQGNPKPKFEPVLLLVDEWVSVYSSFKAKEQERLLAATLLIAIRGLKQDVRFYANCHSAAVGMIGFSKADLTQLNVLALYNYVTRQGDDWQNLPSGYQPVTEKALTTPRKVGDRFTAVTFCDGTWELAGVPEIELSNISLLPDSETLEKQFSGVLMDYPADAPVNYSQCWKWLGRRANERKDSNSEYVAFKLAVDALKVSRESREQTEQID